MEATGEEIWNTQWGTVSVRKPQYCFTEVLKK